MQSWKGLKKQARLSRARLVEIDCSISVLGEKEQNKTMHFFLGLVMA